MPLAVPAFPQALPMARPLQRPLLAWLRQRAELEGPVPIDRRAAQEFVGECFDGRISRGRCEADLEVRAQRIDSRAIGDLF